MIWKLENIPIFGGMGYGETIEEKTSKDWVKEWNSDLIWFKDNKCDKLLHNSED